MLKKAVVIAGVALLCGAGPTRADEPRPAGAGTGEAVAWIHLRGGAHVTFRAAGKPFAAQVGMPLLRSDVIEVPRAEFVVVRLRNGYVVKIDEDTTVPVASIVSLDAPPTRESLAAQLDRVLTKEERGRAERIAGAQARLAGAESVAPQSDSAPPPPAAARPGPVPPPSSPPPGSAPPTGSAAPGGYPPPGAFPGGYPPPGGFPGGYPPPGAPSGASPPGAASRAADNEAATGGTTGADLAPLPAGALVGKVVGTFRGDDGQITLYLNKGTKDKLRVGMTGNLLLGSEGGRLLDGASFTITKVLGENQAVASSSYGKSFGKNNRFIILKSKQPAR